MPSQKSADRNLFLSIDRCFMKITRALACVSPVLLIIMAVLATVNVILSKVFTTSIPGVVNWITYLLVPVIYFAVSHELLYRGLTYVDIFTGRFPWWLNMIIRFLSSLIGAGSFGLIAYFNISKLKDTITYGTLSEVGTGGFPLWPFYLVLVLMCAVLALTFLWCSVRVLVNRGDIPYDGTSLEPGPEAAAGKEDNL